MVALPGGTFDHGGFKVAIAPACFDKTEVTVLAYAACVTGGFCTPPTPNSSVGWYQFCNWKHPEGREQHPVNCVTWDQAASYCAARGQRLPTDAEWEWAARGGKSAWKYPWGDAPPSASILNACGSECPPSWMKKTGQTRTPLYVGNDGYPETAPVGSFPGTWMGLLDLGGNVAEWTSGEAENANERILRGGNWLLNEAARFAADYREAYPREYLSNAVGFRCANTI